MNAVIIEQLKQRIAELEAQEPALFQASCAADKALKECKETKAKNTASDAWIKVYGEISTLKGMLKNFEGTAAPTVKEQLCQS